MKAINKINNNVALCIDDNGNELIAFGKGIGFPSMPYQITDLSKIDRTFYQVKQEYLPLFKEVDEQLFSACSLIIDYARSHCSKDISDSLYYILIDHLSFAIERTKKHVYIPMKLPQDIQFLYEEEIRIGKWSTELINQIFAIHMPPSEATIIAMHIIECEENNITSKDNLEDRLVNNTCQLVETNMNLKINKESFNYSRFSTHIVFLLQRQQSSTAISSDNLRMYEKMVKEFPNTSICVDKIGEYLLDDFTCAHS